MKFKNAINVVCDGVKYTVKKFKKKFEQQFTAQLEWEASITLPNVSLSDVVKEKSPSKGKGETASIERGLGEIASGYGDFQCKEAVAAMATYLKKNKQDYRLITMHYPSGGTIISLSREAVFGVDSKKSRISENGYHYGIEYKRIVYCNVHPFGLPRSAGEADFWGVGKAARTVLPK